MHCGNCGNQLAPNLKFCPRCGTPVGEPSAYTPPAYTPPAVQQPPQQPHSQVQTSWGANPQAAAAREPRKKSRLGKILLILFALLVVGVAGAGIAVYYGVKYVESSLKSSDAYKMAEGKLKSSRAVADSLGEIKSTGFPIGTYKEEADGTGGAIFTMSVEGTKASGQYVATMEREHGTWRIANAVVKVSDGETVNVVDDESGSGDTEDNDGDSQPDDESGGGRPQISGGVLNDKAIILPAPVYPTAGKAVHASGKVVVQVTVDEGGSVVAAKAVSGHPLLQASAVAAARQARFTPTLLSGKPIKVNGLLTYEFKPE
ncbi:MAG: cytochrome c oxidase assembly factor Coa1 family protein [Pyrinomonadaceae bacterium]